MPVMIISVACDQGQVTEVKMDVVEEGKGTARKCKTLDCYKVITKGSGYISYFVTKLLLKEAVI